MLISVSISSPDCEGHVEVEVGRPGRVWSSVERSHISMRWSASFQRATCSNRLGVEVGAELAVEHEQHVAVELGGDPGAVVVGGDQPGPVLDQVGAEQEPVVRRS